MTEWYGTAETKHSQKAFLAFVSTLLWALVIFVQLLFVADRKGKQPFKKCKSSVVLLSELPANSSILIDDVVEIGAGCRGVVSWIGRQRHHATYYAGVTVVRFCHGSLCF